MRLTRLSRVGGVMWSLMVVYPSSGIELALTGCGIRAHLAALTEGHRARPPERSSARRRPMHENVQPKEFAPGHCTLGRLVRTHLN